MSTYLEHIFRAEFGEDRFLWANHGHLFERPGFYLDIGCGPPVSGSNTHWLRALGWSGVGIDANPGYAEQWERQTKPELTRFLCAILSPAPLVKFTFAHHCPGWSRIGEIPGVAQRWFGATRLEPLLSALKVPQIDFLSLDLEGAEFDVLVSAPELFGGMKPAKVIVAEHSTAQTDGQVKRDERVMRLLDDYRMVHETKANYVFIHESEMEPTKP